MESGMWSLLWILECGACCGSWAADPVLWSLCFAVHPVLWNLHYRDCVACKYCLAFIYIDCGVLCRLQSLGTVEAVISRYYGACGQ